VHLRTTGPTGNSQTEPSKSPRGGARYSTPRATKMVRIVQSVTTVTSARKTKRGKMENLPPNASSHSTTSTSPLPYVGLSAAVPLPLPLSAAGGGVGVRGRRNSYEKPRRLARSVAHAGRFSFPAVQV